MNRPQLGQDSAPFVSEPTVIHDFGMYKIKFQVHFTVKSLFLQYDKDAMYFRMVWKNGARRKILFGVAACLKIPIFFSTRKPTKSPYATGLKEKRPLLTKPICLAQTKISKSTPAAVPAPSSPPPPPPLPLGREGPASGGRRRRRRPGT